MPTQSTTTSTPPVSCVARPWKTRSRSERPGQLARRDDLVGAELGGEPALLGVLGGGDDACRRSVRRRSAATVEQAERAGTDHGDGRRAATTGGGVDRAGGGLDHDRGLVGQTRRAPAPAGCGGRPSGPAAAGVGAVAALQPRLQVAEGDALAQVDAPGAHASRTGLTPRAAQTAPGTARTRVVVEVAHHLVARGRRGTTRWARSSATTCRRRWRGRCRRCRRDEGGIAPSRAREVRLVDVLQGQRTDAAPRPGDTRPATAAAA